jgi:hypothetical protein
LAVVGLVWVRVPVPAGLTVNVTPPFALSFRTLAVSAIVPFSPINFVPLGVRVTLLKVEGVPEQAASWIMANARKTSRLVKRARLFMAPPSFGTHTIAVGITRNI